MIRSALLASVAATLTFAIGPALAQNQAADQDKSTGEMAEDIATQPAEDVGIDKKEIPPQLEKIKDDPYSLKGINTCADILAAVEDVDAALGVDLDIKGDKTKEAKRKETAGRVGGAIVNSFVPFRGLIREISGAAGRERRYNEAIYAGVVRRSFLKGVGLQKKCAYPASPDPDALK